MVVQLKPQNLSCAFALYFQTGNICMKITSYALTEITPLTQRLVIEGMSENQPVPRTQTVSMRCFGSGSLISYWIFGEINENLIGCCAKPACGTSKSLISSLPITCVYYIKHWSFRTPAKLCSRLSVFSICDFRLFNTKYGFCRRRAVIRGEYNSMRLRLRSVYLSSVFESGASFCQHFCVAFELEGRLLNLSTDIFLHMLSDLRIYSYLSHLRDIYAVTTLQHWDWLQCYHVIVLRIYYSIVVHSHCFHCC